MSNLDNLRANTKGLTMNKLDGAVLTFYRKPPDYCHCAKCARLVARLEIDFGSLLPDVDADGPIKTDCEAPLGHWLTPGMLEWVPRGAWATLSSNNRMEANRIVSEWIVAARAQILRMTGADIADAIDTGAPIQVVRVQ